MVRLPPLLVVPLLRAPLIVMSPPLRRLRLSPVAPVLLMRRALATVMLSPASTVKLRAP